MALPVHGSEHRLPSTAIGNARGMRWLLLSLLLATLPAAAQDPPQPARQVVDRVAAVVDQDPILLSDIDQLIGLGIVQRQEGEGDFAFRQRVLEGVIELRLRLHEVGRFGFERLPVEAIEARVEEIRAAFPSESAFEDRLEELAMSKDDLRQLVARQEAVLRYVEERLGPRVFVSLHEVQAYYDAELVPALQERGAQAPPLEEVREEIRGLLKAQRLNQEIERWTEELRREADVEILLDDYPDTLPPVVEQFGPADTAAPPR